MAGSIAGNRAMLEITITDLLAALDRHNGMALETADDAPIARDPLNSEDPKIREAAQALAAAAACASRVA
jgi:hypothetical protein